MNSLWNRGWAPRALSHAWISIGVAALFALHFSGNLAAQHKVELKEIKLEALGPTVLTKNEASTKVTAIFSDDTQKDVTHSDRCSWDTGKYSQDEVLALDGKVAINPYMVDRVFTVQVSYTDNNKTVKSNPITFTVHDDYVLVPDFNEKTEAEAVALLRKKGLKEIIKKVMPSGDDTDIVRYGFNGPGTVWDQDPWSGEVVPKGSTVTLSIYPRAVPDLSGYAIAEAQEIIQRIGLNLEIESVEAQTNDQNFDPGDIISQIPPYGTLITKDIKKLSVTVNKMEIPDLSGYTIPQAQEVIQRIGLNWEIESVEAQTFDENFDPDVIISQIPPSGTLITKNIKKLSVTVNLKIVPDLSGYTIPQAQEKLKKLGLNLKIESVQAQVFDYSIGPGQTISQDPAEGTVVTKDLEKILLVLNKDAIEMPDLRGKTESEAGKLLNKVKPEITVKHGTLYHPQYGPGTVVSSLPGKYTLLPQGGKVLLILNAQAPTPSTTPTPIVPQPVSVVALSPTPIPRMGIKVKPPSGPYKPGDTLSFWEDLDRKQGLYFDYTWYIDGQEVGKRNSGTRGVAIEYPCQQPGMHYVQLVARCAALGWEDAIRMNFGIEYPPDPILRINVSLVAPATAYIKGVTVRLEAIYENLPEGTFHWYEGFQKNPIGTGPVITYKLPDDDFADHYDIMLGFREKDDNFDSLKATKTIKVGDPPIGLMGRNVNRFRVDGVPDNVRIASSYWKGGYTTSKVSVAPGWSKFVNFRDIGAVDALDFYTGLQADGHNTGFLVYVPEGRSRIHFEIYGFRFGDPGKTFGAWKGFVRYSINIPVGLGHTVIPQTLRWIEEHARYGVAEWQTEEGSICRARIWKAKSSAGMSGSGAWQRIFVKGGFEDLGCEQYDPNTDPGTGITTAGISSATQTGGQFQSSLVHPGSAGQTTQTGQAIPGWYTTPGGQPPGGAGTSGGGTGTGGAGTGNLSNVTVSQQNVTITFWDHGQEDGDIINVYLNGNLIRGNVVLKNTKMSFQATLNSGQNNFEIEAVNEGRIPPNTASVNISHVTNGPATQIYERKSGARASMALTAP